MANLEKVKEFFRNDLFATQVSGILIEQVDYHFALCKMPLTAQHKNARGMTMGGAVFTLADFAAAVAANSELGDEHVVSLHADISYLSVARGDCLIAEAKSVKHGGSTTLYRVDVADLLGNCVAVVNVTGYVLKNNGKKS